MYIGDFYKGEQFSYICGLESYPLDVSIQV
jgi:hypothetical protein